MNKSFFNDLLSKEMSRKEFLLHVGLLVLTISGVMSFLKTVSDPHLISKGVKPKTGFGSGPYGV